MMKKWKAMFLLVLMLGSVGLANAESPKGEADEKTGEEGIVAQFDNELDTMLAQFQSEECRQIVSLAYEIAKDKEMGNESQFTDKEIGAKNKEVCKFFSTVCNVDSNTKAGLSFACSIFNLGGLSNKERANLVFDADVYRCMYEILLSVVGNNVYDPENRMNMSILVINAEHKKLYDKLDNEVMRVCVEINQGEIDLEHYQEVIQCLGLCDSVLKGTDIGMLIDMIPGNELCLAELLYLSSKDENKGYLDINRGILEEPDFPNPTPIEQMIIDCAGMIEKSWEEGFRETVENSLRMSEEENSTKD